MLQCKCFREKSIRKRPITKLATYFRHYYLILSVTTKRYQDDTTKYWPDELLIFNAFHNKKKNNNKVRVSTELGTYKLRLLIKKTSYIPVQVCTFLQKKNNYMNRQKAEEKGIGREGSRQGNEVGRASK